MRDHLKRLNAFLDNQEITHPQINNKRVHSQKHFRRSFKHSFNHGGRFYGHWVVTLPKEEMSYITRFLKSSSH